MKLLSCPVNGLRPLQEFVYGGEVRLAVNPEGMTDEEWTDYLFNRQGEPGVISEWWYHAPSGTWFVAERDVTADQVLRTYLYEDRSGK